MEHLTPDTNFCTFTCSAAQCNIQLQVLNLRATMSQNIYQPLSRNTTAECFVSSASQQNSGEHPAEQDSMNTCHRPQKARRGLVQSGVVRNDGRG